MLMGMSSDVAEIQRSSATIRAQIADMERSLEELQSSVQNLRAQRIPATKFPKFPELSPELRLRIWGFVIDAPHDVEVKYNNDPAKCQFVPVKPGTVPIALCICHESRSEALKKIVPFFTGKDDRKRALHIYINPTIDTLFIRTPVWPEFLSGKLCDEEDTATIPTPWKTLEASAGLAEVVDRKGLYSIVVIKVRAKDEDEFIARHLGRLDMSEGPPSFDSLRDGESNFQVDYNFEKMVGWHKAWAQDGTDN